MRFVIIRIRGRVQGVGCRMLMASMAKALGLGGWVRNDSDGSVRARLEGEEGKIDEMLQALSSQHDPLGVDVRQMEVLDKGALDRSIKPFELAF